MQLALGFGPVEDIEWIRDKLKIRFGYPGYTAARSPIGQLVKSLISGRTRDEVSLGAYHRLIEAYPDWSEIASAATADIEAIIGDVTFPDVKAKHLREALHAIMAFRPDFDLGFLSAQSVASAIDWLERLPGVGRKVSASTLNFSTLHMPAFVIDTHILRILRRFGFVRSKADTRTAYDVTMATLYRWNAADLAEFHIVIKRLGQNICHTDDPCCHNCPLSQRCQAFAIHSRNPKAVWVK